MKLVRLSHHAADGRALLTCEKNEIKQPTTARNGRRRHPVVFFIAVVHTVCQNDINTV